MALDIFDRPNGPLGSNWVLIEDELNHPLPIIATHDANGHGLVSTPHPLLNDTAFGFWSTPLGPDQWVEQKIVQTLYQGSVGLLLCGTPGTSAEGGDHYYLQVKGFGPDTNDGLDPQTINDYYPTRKGATGYPFGWLEGVVGAIDGKTLRYTIEQRTDGKADLIVTLDDVELWRGIDPNPITTGGLTGIRSESCGQAPTYITDFDAGPSCLTARIISTSGGVTVIGGNKGRDATVSVSGVSAGAVSYPTGGTWQATVTDTGTATMTATAVNKATQTVDLEVAAPAASLDADSATSTAAGTTSALIGIVGADDAVSVAFAEPAALIGYVAAEDAVSASTSTPALLLQILAGAGSIRSPGGEVAVLDYLGRAVRVLYA